MGKIKSVITVAIIATFMVGCAGNVKSLGTIGNTQFYRVKNSTFSGPNFSALVTKDICEDTAHIEQVFGGPGLGHVTISAIGQVGAAAVLGTSFPRIPKNVGDNINVSGGNSNGGNANAEGGSAGANASGGNSSSESNATGGNGNGGNATGGSAVGGSKVHPASPGNGGIPGNGGQNGNKP